MGRGLMYRTDMWAGGHPAPFLGRINHKPRRHTHKRTHARTLGVGVAETIRPEVVLRGLEHLLGRAALGLAHLFLFWGRVLGGVVSVGTWVVVVVVCKVSCRVVWLIDPLLV